MPSATAAARIVNGAGPRRKLRLLCLHGMYQNGATFAAKTRHLRGGHEEHVEFIYIDGPFTIIPKILTQGRATQSTPNSRIRRVKKHDDAFRAWWRPASGSQHVSPTQLDDDRLVLVDFLQRRLCELGGIDGVMGFSQGASLASWMCTAQARDELQWSPRMAILIGGYLGPSQYCLGSGILDHVASLHMFGSNDHVISAKKSQGVVEVFDRDNEGPRRRIVETSIHNQGHVIPKSDTVLTTYSSFLVHQLQLLDAAATTTTPPSPSQSTAAAATATYRL